MIIIGHLSDGFYRLNDETGQLEVASQEIRLLKNRREELLAQRVEYDIPVIYDKTAWRAFHRLRNFSKRYRADMFIWLCGT